MENQEQTESTFKRLFTKLTSSKVLITIAAVVLLYIIVLTDRPAFKEVAIICAGVIPAYITGNVVQHYCHGNKRNEEK